MPRIRLPEPKELNEILSGISRRSEMAERKLKKALGTAFASMDNTEKANLLNALHLTQADIDALVARAPTWNDAQRTRATTVIEKMRDLDASGLTVYPETQLEELRDPNTGEMTTITALFNAVAREMEEIGTGAHRTFIEAVFGNPALQAADNAKHAADAEAVFTRSAQALRRLLTTKGAIQIDNLRKEDVWNCGGLTTQKRMALPLSAVNDPNAYTDKKSAAFLTVVHEATHAVIPDPTTDIYYEHHEHFKKADVQEKLKTADYYRAAVRQIATNTKEQFAPGLAVVKNANRSPQLISAAKEADKILNAAWVSAIRIHSLLRTMAQELKGRLLSEKSQGYQETRTLFLNASRLLGLTLHRKLWETTTEPKLFGSTTKTASFSKVESNSLLTKTTSAEKAFPIKVTDLDLSIVDNKIAMLARLNGKGEDVLVEPDPSLITLEGRVDHVIKQALTTHLPRNQGYIFTKSLDKDVIVIRSLANLHESVAGRELTRETLKVSLPEPMRTYETKVWT